MNPALLFASNGIYWHLPIVIAVVSLIYSATRFDDWDAILREAVRWGVRMSLFLFGIVLILAGLSLDPSSTFWRATLIVLGVIVEISLLKVPN